MVGRSARPAPGQIKRKGDSVDTSKAKPDLLAASSRQVEHKRILAQLEHGTRPPTGPVRAAAWRIDGWTVGLLLLLLFMCGATWLMHDQRITPETFRTSAMSAPARKMTEREPSAHTSEQPPASGEAAAIVNLATAHSTPAPDYRDPTERHAAPIPGRDIGPQPTESARGTQAAAPRKPATSARPSAPADARPTSPTNSDTDVTLLTALVEHTSKPAAVAPERSRDVVERQDGDTTTQLLARCKQLGLIEGMLCRSRICSGRWEADAACRAPSH